MSAAAADWWRPESASRESPAPGAASPKATSPQNPASPKADLEPEASPLGYRALVGFTCVLLLAPQNFFPFLGRLRLAFLLGTLAIIAHTRHRWSLGLPLTKPGREMKVALAVLVWALVTMPFSLWPGGSLALLLGLFIKALAVFWLIGNLVDSLPRLRGMAWTLTLLTVALGFVGISNYLSGVFGGTLDQRILGYDAGLTRNPNDLALMINLIIPIAVALLVSATGALSRVVLFTALCIQVTAVILTFSRAGFLTLATTLGLFGLRLVRRPSRGLVFGAIAVILLGLPFIPASYTDRLLTLTAIDADPTGSAQARWGGTVAALKHAVDHPLLGAGLGMNILVLNESVGATWKVVHNAYLEYAVDLGMPGLAMFLTLLFSSWKSARNTRRTAVPEVGQIAEGIEISLVGFAVAAFFHPAAYEFYFFYIAGLAVALRTVAAREAAVLS